MGSISPEEFPWRALQVPRRHGERGSGALQLVYSVLPAREPLGLPPVVFLCGGPGDSGRGWLKHPPFRAVFEEASFHLNVVLLDQRGCGDSEPNWKLGPLQGSGFLESREKAMACLAAQAEQFRESRPEFDPSVLTPWESALDIGVLADELGAEKVQLWGYSYGTHLAMAAMKAIPSRIARVGLCGFEGPNQTWKMPATADIFLARLGLSDLLRASLKALDREPLILSDGEDLSAFGLRWMCSSWFGVAGQSRRMKARLEGILGGDKAELEKGVAGFRKMLARPAAFYLKDLASGATASRLSEIAREAPGTLLGEDLNFPFPMCRDWWGQADLGDEFRADPTFEGPVMALTGELDGFTPTSNIAEQGRDLPLLVHEEIPGASHDELILSPGPTGRLLRFFSSPLH